MLNTCKDTKLLAFSSKEGHFLDFNDETERKLMEEDFSGDVKLREIPILPFLLLSWKRVVASANHPRTIISQLVGLDHRLCSETPKLSRLLPAVCSYLSFWCWFV